MSYSVYERIKDNSAMVNAFAVPIQSSTFHWHKEYEMIAILRGSLTVRMHSEQIVLEEGDLLLINPNVIHALKNELGQENLCMVIQLKTELFQIEEQDTSDIVFYMDSTKEEEPSCGFFYFYKKMAKILYEALNEEKYAVFRVRAETCSLVADLFEYTVYDICFRDPGAKNQQELTVTMIEYMEKHIVEEKILDLTCHEFGLSRKTMDRYLKKTIGVSGKEIVATLRMEKAKNLLKNSNKNMNYILDACGFGSEKTFYRLFRQETGFTPKAFREDGKIINYNDTLKGYLDFEVPEVKGILKKIVEEKPSE